jgi:hypothetical protein
MDATRSRMHALVEWALAAAAMMALVAGGSLFVRHLSTVSTATPVIAGEVPASRIVAPSVIPPGAVSLPLLLLADGRQIRLGETLSAVRTRLGKVIEAAAPSIERVPNGERVTRSFEYEGTRFQLVFEPLDSAAEPRLAAIYR